MYDPWDLLSAPICLAAFSMAFVAGCFAAGTAPHRHLSAPSLFAVALTPLFQLRTCVLCWPGAPEPPGGLLPALKPPDLPAQPSQPRSSRGGSVTAPNQPAGQLLPTATRNPSHVAAAAGAAGDGTGGGLAAAGPQKGRDEAGSQPCSSKEGAAAGALPLPAHQRSSQQQAGLLQPSQQGGCATQRPGQVDPGPLSPGAAAQEVFSGGLGTDGGGGTPPGELLLSHGAGVCAPVCTPGIGMGRFVAKRET
jgi:hypothetical protein